MDPARKDSSFFRQDFPEKLFSSEKMIHIFSHARTHIHSYTHTRSTSSWIHQQQSQQARQNWGSSRELPPQPGLATYRLLPFARPATTTFGSGRPRTRAFPVKALKKNTDTTRGHGTLARETHSTSTVAVDRREQNHRFSLFSLSSNPLSSSSSAVQKKKRRRRRYPDF